MNPKAAETLFDGEELTEEGVYHFAVLFRRQRVNEMSGDLIRQLVRCTYSRRRVMLTIQRMKRRRCFQRDCIAGRLNFFQNIWGEILWRLFFSWARLMRALRRLDATVAADVTGKRWAIIMLLIFVAGPSTMLFVFHLWTPEDQMKWQTDPFAHSETGRAVFNVDTLDPSDAEAFVRFDAKVSQSPLAVHSYYKLEMLSPQLTDSIEKRVRFAWRISPSDDADPAHSPPVSVRLEIRSAADLQHPVFTRNYFIPALDSPEQESMIFLKPLEPGLYFWDLRVNGRQAIVGKFYYHNAGSADLHFRKAAFHKEYGLPPLGVILLPEDVKKNQKPLTDYLCGMEELPHTKDQNLLISLPDLPKEKSPNDPAEVLVSLFHKNLSLSEAIEAVENISKVVPDPKLVSEVQTLAFFFASRRFGKDQLRELWKRMKPMIATNEFYQEIIEEGEAKGILKGWAKAINSALEDRFDVIPAPKIRDKILLESNPDTLREWFRASQKASSFEDFRQRTGL